MRARVTKIWSDVLTLRVNINLGSKIAALGLAAMLGATALSAFAGPASANACAAKCRQQENQCRIATKGTGNCTAVFQQCMDRCRR